MAITDLLASTTVPAGGGVSIAQSHLPLWPKLLYTAFVMVLVPVYTLAYGLLNFLWFSNLALFTGLAAIWLENRWLVSAALVAVLLPETVWIIDFLASLPTSQPPLGLVEYMHDSTIPLAIRALSLYHLPLPFVLLWMVWRLGYEPRAWNHLLLPAGYTVLLLSLWMSTPESSVNWVLGPWREPQPWMHPMLWFSLVVAGSTVLWWLTHQLVTALLKRLPPPT